MGRPRFIHNLRRETYDPSYRAALRPYGYLLAPNNVTRSNRQWAGEISRSRRVFLADNGNFVKIGEVKRQFKPAARGLRKRVVSLEKELGRSARSEDIPDAIRQDYRALARSSRSRCREEVGDGENMLEAQLALAPSHLIGVEDITAAVWLSLDIEERYLRLGRRYYRRLNESVARRAENRLSRLPSELATHYYPVASAVSYNTAWDAGRVFAQHGIVRIAMGFGAYMRDNNYTDHLMIGRRRVDFGRNLPFRYMRTVAAASGFWDGYGSIDGAASIAFHFLGLGAPIMIPLVTLAAAPTDDLTFDATSPIRDATQSGALYSEKPACRSLKTRKIARRLSEDSGAVWDCPCPFCTEFMAQHPMRYGRGRSWRMQSGERKVFARDLRPGGGLYEAYPLLSEPSGGQLRRQVSYARIGHNHWVLERIMRSLRRAERDDRLEARVANMVRAYVGVAKEPYRTALQTSLDLVNRELSAYNR